MIRRKEVIGNQTLILGDCLEVMPTLGRFDAVVTDPPYGIGVDGQERRIRGKKSDRKGYEFKGWDKDRPDAALRIIASMEAAKIIWGGNYFADLFPKGEKWLSWDKGQRLSQSDCELAYTNLTGALRVFTLNRVALLQDGAQHPTQKPIALYRWLLTNYAKPGMRLLDTHVGSASSLVAFEEMGFEYVAFELDADYYRESTKRLEAHRKQQSLFSGREIFEASTPTQQTLF